MSEQTSKINLNGQALFNALLANEGKTLSLIELASLAKVDAKSGYLTSTKKIAKDKGYSVEKVDDAITLEMDIITTYPSGLKVPSKKTAVVAGYKLVKAQ